MSEFRLLLAQLLLLVPLSITTWFAVEYFLYWRIWWLDIPMHFFGGMWAGLCGLWLITRRGNSPSLILCLAFALFVGIAWEVFEYSEGITASHFSYLFDTAKDIVMDLLGAALGWVLAKRLGGEHTIE